MNPRINPVVKVVGTHALIIGAVAASATVIRDLYILFIKN